MKMKVAEIANLVIVKNELKDHIEAIKRQVAEIRCKEIIARIKLMEEKKAEWQEVYEKVQNQLDEMLEFWMEVEDGESD